VLAWFIRNIFRCNQLFLAHCVPTEMLYVELTVPSICFLMLLKNKLTNME